MRNPELLNKVDNFYNNNGDTIIDIKSIPKFDRDEYDLMDDKDFSRYIADIERTIRNSFEYRQFIQYLKLDEGMNQCSFLENVTSENNSKVKIEIHHEPLTLYDICLAVVKKRMSIKEPLDVELVSEEVMYLHYIGWVGLIPLSSVIHELVHNQYLFIPLDKVRGDYRKFVDSYYNYIDPEVLDCLDISEQATLDYNEKYKGQMKLLNKHDIYINAEGSYELNNRDIVKNEIKNRINVIKNNKVNMVKVVNK